MDADGRERPCAPAPLRRYIQYLETNCDPAGILRDNARLANENDWLRIECANLAARAALFDAAVKALEHFTFPGVPEIFQSNDDGCTEAIVVDARVHEARRVIDLARKK